MNIISQEYWSLIANILVPGKQKTLEAHFAGDKNGKIELHSQKEVDALVEKLQKEKFEVLSVKNGDEKKEAVHCHLQQVLCSRKHRRRLNYVYTKDNASCTGTL